MRKSSSSFESGSSESSESSERLKDLEIRFAGLNASYRLSSRIEIQDKGDLYI